MANTVAFYRGLAANLNSAPKHEGGFYLTTDTHRLKTVINGTMVDINRYIQEIANSTALAQLTPAKGDFVWVEKK